MKATGNIVVGTLPRERLVVGLSLALAVAGLLLGVGSAHAQTTTSSTTANAFPLTTSAPSYTGTANIVVSGSDPSADFVSITVTNPRGDTVGTDNPQNAATNANGNFSATFQASWPLWNSSGTYTVTASAPVADNTGVAPTSVVKFQYTAVPVTTTTTSSSTPSVVISTGTSTSSSISAIDLVPLVIVVVIVVGVVGFLMRSRGRRGAPSRSPAQPTTR